MREPARYYPVIAGAMIEESVTPFLGAGVNLCGRPAGVAFRRGGEYLPDAAELAQYLDKKFGYSVGGVGERDLSTDLLRVAQYAHLVAGDRLSNTLHELFDVAYPPNSVHTLLASLPRRLRESGLPQNDQLIVTANYDDTLERAFDAEGEPHDVVSYYKGKFLHWGPGSAEGFDAPVVIDEPERYTRIAEDVGTTILKIHGLVDRKDPARRWESFVITEDDYIDYLTRTDIRRLLPVNIVNRLKRSNFLFLGYSLRDWNIRAILHAIWRDQTDKRHWAVLLSTDEVEQSLWQRRNVQMLTVALDEFVDRLDASLEAKLQEAAHESAAHAGPVGVEDAP